MKKIIMFCFILAALNLNLQLFAQNNEPNGSKTDNCIECHKINDLLPEDFDSTNVHAQVGLSCADCHGGDRFSEDEETAMSEEKGFVGVPDIKEIPNFCGKCHSDIDFMRKYNPRAETDQVDQYYTSIHGKQLKKGDENVATCVSCHTAHKIFKVNNPRSSVYALNVPGTCNQCHGDKSLAEEYNIDPNVYTDYANSVHGIALLKNKDIGAPACNDCHGNHGAVPPGISSIANVCGLCHVYNMEYFQASKMAQPFKEMDFHGCEECHGNHAVKKPNDEFVGVGEESICIECHDEGDKGYIAAENIHSKLKNLVSLYDSVNVKLEKVRKVGMDDVDLTFMIKDINQAIVKARTTVHTFDTSEVAKVTNAGIKTAAEALNKADDEISEYHTRTNGFGIATVIFFILIILIYLKLKNIEKKSHESNL